MDGLCVGADFSNTGQQIRVLFIGMEPPESGSLFEYRSHTCSARSTSTGTRGRSTTQSFGIVAVLCMPVQVQGGGTAAWLADHAGR